MTCEHDERSHKGFKFVGDTDLIIKWSCLKCPKTISELYELKETTVIE